MSTPIPSTGRDENHGSNLIAVTWSLSITSTALVALRFYTRARITHNIWWDDWWILMTLMLVLVFSGLLTAYGTLGGGRHLYFLVQSVEPSRLSLILELNWVSQTFTVAAIAMGKISVALLIYRIQAPNTWRTRFLIFCSASSVAVMVVLITLFFAQCTPVTALWMASAGHCWPPTVITSFGVFAGTWFALIDTCLALVPITIIWSLNLSLKKRLQLGCLLSLGILAAISGCIKTSYIPTLTARADITWITVSLLIWNACEANVIVIAACLPTIRPLFINVIQGVKSMTSVNSSQKYSYRRRRSFNKHTVELHNMSSTSNLKGQDGAAARDDPKAEDRQDFDNAMEAGRIRKTIRMEVASAHRDNRVYEQ